MKSCSVFKCTARQDLQKSDSTTFHSMDRWRDRVALVTGASTGIGAGICRELVKHGMIVVGCARNLERMQKLGEEVKMEPGKFHPIKCDLSNEPEILSMFEEIKSKYGRLDVCINNAAFSTNSHLLSGETSHWRNMLEVNVLALCICSREAVKIMRENNIDDGQIIHINSVGGHRLVNAPEFHGFNFYCGTKFMVRALTEGLRLEVHAAKTHIRVASISPGAVESEFLERSYGNTPEQAQALFANAKILCPKDIGDAVVYILQCPPHVDINEIIVQPVEMSF